jgi:hypothetical protein
MHLRTFGSRVAGRMTELTFSINTVLCPQITKTIGSTKSKYSEGLHVSPQNLRSAEVICGPPTLKIKKGKLKR